MFIADKRSKRIIILAHCILNQNSKLERLAMCYPGAVSEIANEIVESGAGILQMPCPEIILMGLNRSQSGNLPSIESEKTRVGIQMSGKQSVDFCESLALQIVYQIEEYQRNDFKVLGIIGVNCSPTCGVETTWSDGCEREGRGVFLNVIFEILKKKGISIPIVGIKPDQIQKAMEIVKRLLN